MNDFSYVWRLWLRRLPKGSQRAVIRNLLLLTALSFGLASILANLSWASGPILWFCRALVIVSALATALSCLYAYFNISTSPETNFPESSVFLRRNEFVSDLETRLLKTKSGLLSVTGESGTGKSTLVRQLLAKKLLDARSGAEWKIATIDAFRESDSFKEQIRLELEKIGVRGQDDTSFNENASMVFPDSAASLLLIFDQFEHFLNAAASNVKLRDWLKSFLDHWASRDQSRFCVLILRMDAFVHLGFLDRPGDRVFENTYWLYPVTFKHDDYQNSDVREAMLRLRDVVKDQDTAREIRKDLCICRSVLPFEVDLLVKTLADIKVQTGRNIISVDEYNELGRRSGLIRRYFLRSIDGSRDRRAASAVLFALSCSGATQYLSNDQITKATHRDRRTVDDALRSLTRGPLRLVVHSGDEDYAVAHDYIAQVFQELSGRLLHPTDRANVRHFTDLLRHPRGNEDRLNNLILNHEMPLVSVLNWVFAVIAIGIVARLFNAWPAIDQTLLGSGATIGTSTIDWRYFPSFLASFSCAFYCWQLFRNFLFKISQRRAGTAVTVFVVSVMILMGTLLPHLWLAFACLAGMAIGVRLGILYWPLPNKPAAYSGNLFQGLIARYFIFLTLIFVVFGLGLGILRYWFFFSLNALEQFNSTYGFLVEVILSILMSAYMIASWRAHASRSRAAMMLAEWDRMKVF